MQEYHILIEGFEIDGPLTVAGPFVDLNRAREFARKFTGAKILERLSPLGTEVAETLVLDGTR